VEGGMVPVFLELGRVKGVRAGKGFWKPYGLALRPNS